MFNVGSSPGLELTIALLSTIIALICTFKVLKSDHERPAQVTVAVPEQSEEEWVGEALENPEIKVPGSSAIQCYCPANGRLLGHVNPSTPDGIDRAIAKAKEAQKEWGKTSWGQRRKVLRTMLKYILENQDTIATVACLDSGKTKVDASFGEILVTAEKVKWTISHGEKALKAEKRPTNFLMMYKYNEVRWEPLGVVAACVSWNYPFHNLMGPIISSLFSGNALILKASEQTAWSLNYFTSIARASLSACGHSSNLIQPIVCWPSVASHLTSHPDISHITFIGSRPVAYLVCASAAKALIPVCVELGGKDPAIILDDVNSVENAIAILMRGVFQSAGQNCIGIERIIALPKSYQQLVRALEPRIRNLRIGSALDEPDNIDVGAMISKTNFERLESLISDAVSQGARCLVGGKRHLHPKYPKGHYFAPTLLVDVTSTMHIAQEELFAPICLLMRASSVDEAIVIANSSSYALGASVFGSKKSDLEKVTSGVRAGMVSVNDFAVYYAVQLPFGGVGGSGYGRFAGEEGLRSLCNSKSVSRDRFPRLMSTSIPGALRYPIGSGKRAWDVCRGIVELGYADEWKMRAKGLWKVVRYGASESTTMI